MLLTTYIRPKRLTWRVTFGLDDLPGGLPRPEAARGPGRRSGPRRGEGAAPRSRTKQNLVMTKVKFRESGYGTDWVAFAKQ